MFEKYQDPRETLLEKLDPGVEHPPTFGPLTLNLEDRSATIEGAAEEIPLTITEYQMLWLLVRAQGGLIKEGEFISFLHEDDEDDKDIPFTNTVYVYIHRLRRKLEHSAPGAVSIINKPDQGYYISEGRHPLKDDGSIR